MYVITFDTGRVKSCTTLAGVLAFFNCDDDLRRRTPVESVRLRHIARGDIPLIRLARGNFAVRPSGSMREILDTIIGEVDRFILRPNAKVLRPFEVSRDAWEAAVAAGRLGYFPEEALAPECRDQGTLFADPDAAFVDPACYVEQQFRARFGFGTNGPEYSPGAGINSRHEVHVAYALQRGEKVRDCVLNAYRDSPDIGKYDLLWLKDLVAVPALRGALPADKLQALCGVMRHDNLAITAHNATRLIALVKPLPADRARIAVDDALFAAGIVPPPALPTIAPPTGENAAPVSPLAARLHSLIAQHRYAERTARAQEEQAKGALTQRMLQRELRLATVERDTTSYSWPNRLALAVMERNVAQLLEALDSPSDQNALSKRAIREELGVVLTGVPAATRRRRIFELCGFSEAEQRQWDIEAAAARTALLQARDAESAREQAEAACWRLPEGRVLNGREYVDMCIDEGFRQIKHYPRGSARVYYIEDPQRRLARKLRAKDGTLAYARARLAEYEPALAIAA